MVEKLSNVKSKDSETGMHLFQYEILTPFYTSIAQSSETPIDPEMAKKHITLNVQVRSLLLIMNSSCSDIRENEPR